MNKEQARALLGGPINDEWEFFSWSARINDISGINMYPTQINKGAIRTTLVNLLNIVENRHLGDSDIYDADLRNAEAFLTEVSKRKPDEQASANEEPAQAEPAATSTVDPVEFRKALNEKMGGDFLAKTSQESTVTLSPTQGIDLDLEALEKAATGFKQGVPTSARNR